MSALALFIGAVFALAAVAAVVSVAVYNRKLDRIAKGEERGAHSSVPEPRTAADVIYKTGILILCIGAAVGAATALSSMRNDLSELKTKQNALSAELGELREALAEAGKETSSFTIGLISADYEKMTADIGVEVALKSFSDDTKVTLLVAGQEVALEADTPGEYKGEFTVGLFDDCSGCALVVTRGDVTYREEQNIFDYAFWDALPMPGFTSTLDYSGGALKGSFGLTFYSSVEDVESVELTYVSAGEDLKTVDVTAQAKSGEEMPYDKDVRIKNENLAFRVKITTASGVTVIQQTSMLYNTEFPTEADYIKILDADGNMLWQEKNDVY